MTVKIARNGDVELAYETFGEEGGEPLLLIMGLGHQMLLWPDPFCEALAAAGFQVARFDNRDSGLSTHFGGPQDRAGQQKWWQALLGQGKPPYSSVAYVEDALAVMDALGWGSAHIAGASMGSAICQMLAVLHPQRVRSVTAMMTMPASSSLAALRHIRFAPLFKLGGRRYTADREGQVQRLVDVFRLVASPDGSFDEPWAREVAERCYDRRPFDPAAERRQLAAGRATKGTLDVGRITVPTLIVYGENDPIVRPSGPKALLDKVPGSRLVTYPRMGHNLPPHVWAPLVEQMSTQVRLST
ncbi:alpha/beta fold hydrolase [Dactylosporangium siamense]|uniref:Alpha/beta hydrolase n=1 Tax=Dactylosporangium siamense TaxID=685454 RepID=A0A919UEF8_9ACTN|nr:alpha/beta hydrolase [Dactylosporangium siamense]GIG49016.1 alpha/beta hydrolase [Dactylosporangium siamense]